MHICAIICELTRRERQTYSLDPLPYVRTQALSFIATLLREKPEQEQNLLRLLVNKLVRSICTYRTPSSTHI